MYIWNVLKNATVPPPTFIRMICGSIKGTFLHFLFCSWEFRVILKPQNSICISVKLRSNTISSKNLYFVSQFNPRSFLIWIFPFFNGPHYSPFKWSQWFMSNLLPRANDHYNKRQSGSPSLLLLQIVSILWFFFSILAAHYHIVAVGLCCYMYQNNSFLCIFFPLCFFFKVFIFPCFGNEKLFFPRWVMIISKQKWSGKLKSLWVMMFMESINNIFRV